MGYSADYYNTITIEHVSNTMGTGYSIHAHYRGKAYPEATYLDCSKREAEALYRERFGLKYKPLERTYWDNPADKWEWILAVVRS